MKRELLLTQNREVFQNATDKLLTADIPYKIKVVGAGSFGRSLRNTLGTLRENYGKFYYIFVDKKNLEQAKYIINQK